MADFSQQSQSPGFQCALPKNVGFVIFCIYLVCINKLQHNVVSLLAMSWHQCGLNKNRKVWDKFFCCVYSANDLEIKLCVKKAGVWGKLKWKVLVTTL